MPAGGKREGAGRKHGSLNKATADIKALAHVYGPDAIFKLATMAGLTEHQAAESEVVRLGAVRELLDRGYGKAPQALTGADGGALHLIVTGVRRALDDAEADDDA